ncbi:MAG: phosphatidylinositol-specific phospholipase C/glycerophosphodiester phosphodiesterase family protein [Rhodothermales bacterium]
MLLLVAFFLLSPPAAERDTLYGFQPDKDSLSVPLPRAHAHNDYEHERPLLDALDHGFGSLEVDVHLVDGELLVAHDADEVVPGRTLASLYLDPLRERIRQGGGQVYPEIDLSLILLIDIKTEGKATYLALREVLRDYAEILTAFTPTSVEPGAVTAIISGNRPRTLMEAEELRYAAYDGRLSDLAEVTPSPPSFMPLVSSNWSAITAWQGEGALPDSARTRLAETVVAAHEQGKILRFWATADRPEVWDVLWEAGVDLLGADDLSSLQAFLRARGLASAPRRGFLTGKGF